MRRGDHASFYGTKSGGVWAGAKQDDDHVYVDSHILSTPVVADLTGNGEDVLVTTVSYFFDETEYADPALRHQLGLSADLGKYVASGVVAFSLATGKQLWSVELDLTTATSSFPAYAVTSPVLADFDGDGKLEILVGTGAGFVYMISHKGLLLKTPPGNLEAEIEADPRYEDLSEVDFPLTMGSVWTEPMVGDVDGDGYVDIVVVDSNANVVAYTCTGIEIWSSTISGHADDTGVLADMDSDGVLDVVIGTNAGHVWAFKGEDGTPLPQFPLRFGGRIETTPLILDLVAAPTFTPSRHIVVGANDGIVYVVNPTNGRREKFDIGAIADTTMLADDLIGNGNMDVLVTTTTGELVAIGTDTPYSPLNSKYSEAHGGRTRIHRAGYLGIAATSKELVRRECDERLSLRFTITDQRRTPNARSASRESYKITVTRGSTVYAQASFGHSGEHELNMEVPNNAEHLTLTMTTTQGLYFEHTIPITYLSNPSTYPTVGLLLPLALILLTLLPLREWFTKQQLPDIM
eukprot:CAMPEP_0119155724 /NCGR_PEP_ID=MMETSP1310-20130426/51895_1 /TAXON_ID=464262 /ORGANISM="Genus nov. species nov., Strain RCC2339" /LENGTH=519 /DNA_ID=CAMNT_0007148327 /DNA_START=6 /DNA_END=1565 /DNA_ORIENTATION=+